jgi:hypothetical protein
MAVVQISRIQVRRGKENSGTGVPQLASGELAWSVDTQNLYIGNGSVAEGAPAVGNTKVLTELDLSVNGNVLNLIQYVYKANDTTIQTGPNANTPVVRSIQDRFDNYVSTVEFGAVGDGVTDDTAALQRAIDQLFLNPNGTTANADTVAGIGKRVELVVPPGKYLVTDTLYIPSYANIIGSGADKTILYYNPVSTFSATTVNNSAILTTTNATARMIGATVTGPNIIESVVLSVDEGVSLTLSNNASASASGTYTLTLSTPAIQFVNDSSTVGNPSTLGSTLGTTQPRNIRVTDLTVYTPTGKNTCLQLDAVRDSTFENINLKGDWNATVNTLSRGMIMQAVSSLVTCEHNLFKNIKFESFNFGVYAKQDIRNNIFEDCFFTDAWQGMSLGDTANGSTPGEQYGPRETEITSCKFYNIRRQAINVQRGTNNITRDCKYINVGCNGGGNSTAQYPQVFFNTFGNSSQNDVSDRHADLATGNLSTQYVPEIAGHGTYSLAGTKNQLIGYVSTSSVLSFRLPCSTTLNGVPTKSIVYSINYIYSSSNNSFTRRGTITVAADIQNNKIQLSDEYDFAGTDVTQSGGGTTSTQLDFKAYFLDATSSIYTGGLGQSITSIGIYYTNSLNGDSGNLSYSYTASL